MKKKTNIKAVIRKIVREEVAMKTMGGGTYDSSKAHSVMSSQYGDLMSNSSQLNPDAMVASMGVDPNKVDDSIKNIFTKDYRNLLKKVDDKSKQTQR